MSNAGFESGFQDWTSFTGSETITSDAYAGSNALALSTNGSGVDQTFSVAAGERYTLSAYGKTSSTEWSGLVLRFYDNQWNELESVTTQITSQSWEEYTFDAIAPTGAANGVYSVWKGGDDGTTTLDEFGISGTATPPPPTGNELLSNSSFESNFAGWNAFSGSEQIATTGALDGDRVLQLTATDSGISQSVSIDTGSSYQLSLFAKTDTATGDWIGAGIDLYDVDWNQIDTVSTRITASDWQEYQLDIDAAAGASYAVSWFYQGGDSGTTTIDQVSFQAADILPSNQLPVITSNGSQATATITIAENIAESIANIRGVVK